jgi:phosphoribosylformylglycinamidine cyclo-ligase
VKIDKTRWDIPAIFKIMQDIGNINEREMFRVFNMGIGMALIVSALDVKKIMNDLNAAGESVSVIGEVTEGERSVQVI